MAVHKIVLFYAFTPLPDPRAVQLWQQALGERWHLTGRVIVSEHGINATLGGTVEDLTGTPSRGFAEWARDHREAFR